MPKEILSIRNLSAVAEGKEILKGVNLTVSQGEIHAIMGPNGAGKSTLSKVLLGHPFYEVTEGEVLYMGQNLLDMEPYERAQAGIFLGFQYPLELAGVSNFEFMQACVNAKRAYEKKKLLSDEEFKEFFEEKQKLLKIKEELSFRNVNEGFSGGEKKRNEILQMALFEPTLAILDETDSGLDIDALKLVAEGIKQIMTKKMGLILITHYQRLLNFIKPDFVHVLMDGQIKHASDASLAETLEERGYDWIVEEEINPL